MGYSTEELWFTEWENGGTPYDAPENYEKFNPVNHVAQLARADAGGPRRARLPHAGRPGPRRPSPPLQRKGIDSQLLYFPDENHWVLKPQNSVLWHDTVNAWLKKHLGK